MDQSKTAAVVNHAGGSYPILVDWGLLDDLGDHLLETGIRGPVYVISDSNVFPSHGRTAQRSLQKSGIEAHCFILPAGEQSKSLDVAEKVYQWLVERRAERGHTIIAVGGGVVGDLAGFVAATFLRGMPFVQVPTSMAAMVDASIGGKVAVNLPQGKNLVGAFYQPKAVLADASALSSLGTRELAEGWAEAIKHGLILDSELFDLFEEHAESLAGLNDESTGGDVRELAVQVIKRSMAIKAEIVGQDERETLGIRTLLNYGHTIGHGIEAAAGYGEYMHGEAVSVGMMGAAGIGQTLGFTDPALVERQRRILQRFGLPVEAPGVDPEKVLAAMTMDKKTEAGSVKWVLLESLGKAVVSRDVPQELAQETVRALCST